MHSKPEAVSVKDPGAELQVFVFPLDGKSFAVSLNSNDKVLKLKERILERMGMPVEQQSLVYNGRALQSQHGVSEVGLKDQCAVHIVYKLKGGTHTQSLSLIV